VTWAVLGLVIEKPSYGYELGQRFDRRYDGLLAAGMSHIYAALDRLQRDGLVEPLALAPREQARRQPRVRYRATSAGVHAHREWLVSVLHDNGLSTQVLGRMAAGVTCDVDAVRRMLDDFEALCVAEASAAALAASPAEARSVPELVAALVREQRGGAARGQLEWLASARAQLDAFAAAKA
jgi:DNA-binding PadR family transcriptional regulator